MELTQNLLNALPQGAALLQGAQVIAYNSTLLKLCMLLRTEEKLTVGAPLPRPLQELLVQSGGVEGVAILGDGRYTVSVNQSGENTLFLLEKERKQVPEKAISDCLCRLRESLHWTGIGLDGMIDADETRRMAKVGDIQKAYYSMVRTLEHLELVRGERPKEESKQMELVSYCQRLQMEIAPLLTQVEATVQIVPKDYSLFVMGEEPLLQRLILGFVSNAIQRGGHHVVVQLAKSNHRCKIVIWDDSVPKEAPKSVEEQLRREMLAAPDSLDMVTARAIAKELEGSILVGETSEGGSKITIALPLVQSQYLPLASPTITQSDRYNQLLVEFADILPAQAFRLRHIEW